MTFNFKTTIFLLFIYSVSFSQSKEVLSYDNSNAIFLKARESLKKNSEDSIHYYFKKVTPFSKNKKHYKKYLDFITEFAHYYDGAGAFEKSIDLSQKGLAIAEFFEDNYYKSQMLVNISATYRIFHDYKKAIEYGKLATKILENDKTIPLKSKTNALSITAAAFNENNELDSALVYQKKILNYLPELDSTDIRNNIVNIGYTYMLLGDLENSKLYTERGLSLYKPTKNDYALGAIYTNLAMYGRRAKKYKYALRMFDSAIHYSNKSKYIETFVWIYDERAQLYKENKNFVKAIEDLEKLLIIKDSVFKNDRAKSTLETEAKYQTAKKEKEIAIQKEQLLENKLAIKNRNLYAILLGSALLILAIIFFAIYKRNQFKRKQLQKEIDLKDALATIKTQNRLQEQRLRISRDLHDNIGSQLTFIISSVDNLKFVTKDANTKLKNKLAGISSFTTETIYELRDTIWAMNKNEITVEDLHTRILSFIEKAKNATENIDFIVNYNINKNEAFSSLEGMNIFRVIQEAINNAIKYAQASKIEINIDKKENQFLISVIDNGIGFDINSVELGNGLSNMEKRMSEIGGTVKIDSKLEIGTIINIETSQKNTANDV
ncbi:sensor histidine kinase [Polaribacter haliotis]|uniref:histidine kinase n=1 Tax=Polaribacter haliotis TaxID=1888915 RepID=A0A7L8AE25_9FLAO|nr:ATP-binding protein [Polaribacter haliotis]QOD60177.1 sensor histidine kinase [Polaribacter haliotis]